MNAFYVVKQLLQQRRILSVPSAGENSNESTFYTKHNSDSGFAEFFINRIIKNP